MTRFMVPTVNNEPFIHYEWENEEHIVPAEVEGTLPEDAQMLARYEDKWFARLSAPGYLDCTDWIGPYDSQEAALYALWFVYGESGETYTEFIEGKKHVVAGSLSLYGVRNELHGWNVEEIGKDIHLATMGDVDEGYDPNDDADTLAKDYGFTLCGAVESARLKQQFKAAEKAYRGA